MNQIENTKDKILEHAICLFSEKGYAEVSMRELASRVGIKASSIYKHYQSKEEILEGIFTLFQSVMENTTVGEDDYFQKIESPDIETLLKTGYEIFKYLAFSAKINNIVKIIIKEQSRNEIVKKFFQDEFIHKPILSLENQFSQLINLGVIKNITPSFLAKTYHGYIINLYFVHNYLLREPDIERIDQEMNSFIHEFSEMIKS